MAAAGARQAAAAHKTDERVRKATVVREKRLTPPSVRVCKQTSSVLPPPSSLSSLSSLSPPLSPLSPPSFLPLSLPDA